MFSMRRYVSINRRRMRAWQTPGERPWGWDAAVLGLPPTLLMDMNSPSRRNKDFGKKPELWDVRVATALKTWAGDWKDTTVCISTSVCLHTPQAFSDFHPPHL